MCKPSELRPLVATSADQEEVVSPASRLTTAAAQSPSHAALEDDDDDEHNELLTERNNIRGNKSTNNDKTATTMASVKEAVQAIKAIRRTGILALLGFCLFLVFFSVGAILRGSASGGGGGVNDASRHNQSLRKDTSLLGIDADDNHASPVSSTMLRKSSHHDDDTTNNHHGENPDQTNNDEKHKPANRQPYPASNSEMLPSSSIDRTLLRFISSSSFGRETVIELLVNEYTSPISPDVDNMKTRLKNAIDVIEQMENDGDVVGVKDHSYLFVGSVGAAMNHQSLQDNGITHIINWSSTAKCNVYNDIQYLCLPHIRNSDQMLDHIADLDKAVDFIQSAKRAGGKALSHCWYGRNRSVTLLVAYLMKYEGMSIHDAHELVKETRPQADPYRDVLKKYARHYLTPMSSSSSSKGSSRIKMSDEKEVKVEQKTADGV